EDLPSAAAVRGRSHAPEPVGIDRGIRDYQQTTRHEGAFFPCFRPGGTPVLGSSCRNGLMKVRSNAPDPEADPRRRRQWSARYEELRRFQEREGHCNVPREWAPNP